MAKPELRDHRKFLKLLRLLGEPRPHVAGYLDFLWLRGYQTGNPLIGDELDVEAAAEYPGKAGKFAKAAHEAGFIDRNSDGQFVIHDLFEHAPRYVRLRMIRNGFGPEDTTTESSDCALNGAHIVRPQNANGADSAHVEHEIAPKTVPDAPPPKPKPRNKNQKRILPTLDEVRAYFAERGKGLDPEAFFAHYESNGWVQSSGQPIRKWKMAVITWEKNEAKFSRGRTGRPAANNREDDLDAELRAAGAE